MEKGAQSRALAARASAPFGRPNSSDGMERRVERVELRKRVVGLRKTVPDTSSPEEHPRSIPRS